MAENISLHGGPWHGKAMAIPEGTNVVRVNRAALFKPGTLMDAVPSEVPFQEGQYSRVRHTKDFEWDGWKQ